MECYPRHGGGLILSADFGQLELRVAACLSKEPGMLRAFESGVDFHTTNAAGAFYPLHSELPSFSPHAASGLLARIKASPTLRGRGVDLENVQAVMAALIADEAFYKQVAFESVTKVERTRAKSVTSFGVLYGMGAEGLAQQLGSTVEAAQSYIDNYFARNPMVKAWVDATHAQAEATGTVCTPTNRVRYVFDAMSRDQNRVKAARRAAGNAPIQGAASDLTLQALILLEERIQQLGLRSLIVGTVHDSILWDVYPGELVTVYEQCKEVMELRVREQPGFEWICVPITADVEVGRSWGELIGIKSMSPAEAKLSGSPRDVDYVLGQMPKSYRFTTRAHRVEDTKDGPVAKVELEILETILQEVAA